MARWLLGFPEGFLPAHIALVTLLATLTAAVGAIFVASGVRGYALGPLTLVPRLLVIGSRFKRHRIMMSDQICGEMGVRANAES